MAVGKGETPVTLSRAHRILITVVVVGVAVIAAIGFAGSYAAVRHLAENKGFGAFSIVFPIGIDAGIVVLLGLDLLLTWLRIPFPLLRQTAWLLTAATIAFNGAAAWPDPVGVVMHAVIPVLFVVAVEAARHAIGRIADITADRHMESVRVARWLLAFPSTFRLWRRMKLWELRSYDEVIKVEQQRLVYQSQLRSRYGRAWRRRAPVESLMPLRLARYGVPLAETAPAGLAAAGIDKPMMFPTVERAEEPDVPTQPTGGHQRALETGETSAAAASQQEQEIAPVPGRAGALVEQPDQTVSYIEVFAEYVARHGEYPNARQFGRFLAEVYGVGDPATGGPLTEAELRPALQELRQSAGLAEEPVADLSDVADLADGRSGGSDPAGLFGPAGAHPFFRASSSAPVMAPQPELHAAEPVAVPTESAADIHAAGGGALSQTSLSESVKAPAAAETAPAEVTVTDTAEATARVRVPQQRHQEPESNPIRQQVIMVAGWLAEAEDADEKLSGAEVARRLGVAPRTGQRRLREATEYREKELRQQGRAHLRPVSRR